ncbi:porin family protein [Sphingomonas sp. JC676]|uniref:outer membrane protein n=1 Tax=Sphingomonas sp. JC676 TaxID=2768065 RepID=UPI001657E76B|nr:outer membrane beta-barrel protein [Sphingomonas sp. JC676]MBC9032473.1 porin family protein [Sphingomonas sp. JC676]
MKTVSISLLVLLSTVCVTGAAHAQNFDGPSVGVQAGWVENKVRNPETDLGIVAVDASQDSAVVGGYAGYDKTIGKFVLGGEMGLNFGTSDTVSGGSGADRVSLNSKRSFDLSARAGYLVTPTTLLYGRGGYTNDRVGTTVVSATGTSNVSEDRNGWLVGGGLERMVTDHVSARVEYRYADLSDGEGKYDRHQVMTGITYRF